VTSIGSPTSTRTRESIGEDDARAEPAVVDGVTDAERSLEGPDPSLHAIAVARMAAPTAPHGRAPAHILDVLPDRRQDTPVIDDRFLEILGNSLSTHRRAGVQEW
jgi:hypothetical protein